MLKKIIGTAGTRILNAVFNLIILLLITNFIGKNGLGTIGLILLDITIIQLVIDLLAGSAVVYYASRSSTGQLLLPAYLWTLIVIFLTILLGMLLKIIAPGLYITLVPVGFEWHIIGLALLSGAMFTQYNYLIGKEEIKAYNIVFTLQITTLLAVFLIMIFLFHDYSVKAYLIGIYFAYSIGTLLGFIRIVRSKGTWHIKGWQKVLGNVVRYGLVTQLANILNIGNRRFSYYFIRYFSGLGPLGIFTAGMQLTEGLRLIGQSISLVQFSAIANTTDNDYATSLTIRLMKFSVLLTLAAVFILIVLPEDFYTWVFSKDFQYVKPVIIALSPGVVALAANNVFSHYFSGLGNPKINLWSNVVGLIFTLLLAVILIPSFGIIGAAVTTSASYTSSVIYQYLVFRKKNNISALEWVPSKKDFKDFLVMIREQFIN